MSIYQDEIPDRFSYNRFPLTDQSMQKLEAKLLGLQSSTTLNLGDAFIGDEGCKLVSDFLRGNPTVRNLELRGNNISPVGLRVLAPSLKSLSSLRVLSLEWNNLENGVAALTEVLLYSPSLQVLDLRNNKIGPEGASSIAKLIENSSSLERIDLRWNDIGAVGARYIISALRKPHSLQSIDLSGNRIPEELLQETQTLLSKAPEVKTVFSPLKVRKDDENIVTKYETTLMANARHEARISELQALLEQETQRSAALRQELILELEAEKSSRLNSETALERLKEQVYQSNELTQDLEDKLARTLAEKAASSQEVERFQEQAQRLNYSMAEQARGFEERLGSQQRLYKQLEETSQQSMNRMKQEHEDEINELRREFEIQYQTHADTLLQVKGARDSLDGENKSLRQQIYQLRNSFNESSASLNFQKEETDKMANLAKSTEMRLRSTEENRDLLNKKIQDLQRISMENEHSFETRIKELENEIHRLRDENGELNRQVQRGESKVETLQNAFTNSEINIRRLNEDKEELNRILQDRERTHLNKLESLYQEHNNDKNEAEAQKRNILQRNAELEEDLVKSLRERDRAVSAYEDLNRNVQARVMGCIEEVVNAHTRRLQHSLSNTSF